MKVKNFNDYLKTRLNESEIAEIEAQAEMEFQALKALQNGVAQAINAYMKQENIGFNDLVRKLDISPSKLSKIQKGEANLTLASIAHIAALLKRKPVFSFEKEIENDFQIYDSKYDGKTF
ncbi:MAG: helix-turn-helix domain-containing protein [Silvanigrellaceae bacterium]|nr:helix-turn-helix domain-containing protein [Silvanigrellaceae bacterium]